MRFPNNSLLAIHALVLSLTITTTLARPNRSISPTYPKGHLILPTDPTFNTLSCPSGPGGNSDHYKTLCSTQYGYYCTMTGQLTIQIDYPLEAPRKVTDPNAVCGRCVCPGAAAAVTTRAVASGVVPARTASASLSVVSAWYYGAEVNEGRLGAGRAGGGILR